MANIFAIILFIATLVTGSLWCLSKFCYILNKYRHKMIIKAPSKYKRNGKISEIIDLRLKWIETGASFFPMLAIALIIRSFIYEPFQIPSSSMMPTLLAGDFILVKKFAYNIKDPIYQKTLIKVGYPKRGDIVVFKYPENQQLNYIKRTIGLPGDKITYNSITKEITIRPRCYPNISCNNMLPVKYLDVKSSNFIKEFNYEKEKKNIFNNLSQLYTGRNIENKIKFLERKEIIGDVSHYILNIPTVQDHIDMYYHQYNQQIATWIVPSGHYFMMGDNRDNSADSRYWGFVPEENIIGKATAIWMSFEKKEGKWLNSIRFKRIGKIN